MTKLRFSFLVVEIAPYIPPIDPSNASDTQNFDETFLDMEPVIQDDQELTEESDRSGDRTDTDKTDGEDAVLTPAQSRSPSVQPQVEDGVDLFDGYSFKGRHSVLIDEDEEPEEEDEEEEGEEGEGEDFLNEIRQANGLSSAPSLVDEESAFDEDNAPKTPEARKPSLPDVSDTQVAAAVEAVIPADAADVSIDSPPAVPEKAADGTTITPTWNKALPVPNIKDMPPLPPSPSEAIAKLPAAVASKPNAPTRPPRGRKEKSGVAALDKYLSDGGEDDVDNDDDDDWDLVEAPGVEDRNGSRGTSLFARGVVDRYRLAVFRKASTPAKNNQPRNVSGMSLRSDITASEASPSPSPSEKQRRGRNPGLTFRRNPKQFLAARSPAPPSSFSNASGKTLVHSGSMSASTSTGLITPSPSNHPSLSGPSLRSKESTASMGSPSSDDQSVNDEVFGNNRSGDASSNVLQRSNSLKPRRQSEGEPGKPKGRKLKKYKEGAEKVLSLFASPRP